MMFADNFSERCNVGWRVEQATLDPNNPLLEPEYPWESAAPCIGHGTVLKDPMDGKFKGWFVCQEEDVNYVQGAHERRLAYAESEDGSHWYRPMLDLCPYPGYPKTNIMFDYDSGGRSTYASVFIDPDENPDEPYEMFVLRNPAWRCPTFNVAGFGQKPLSSAAEVYAPGGTRGACTAIDPATASIGAE